MPNFRVTVGSAVMRFSEVSGLALDAAPIELRSGHRAGFKAVALASLVKSGAIVLRRGALDGNRELLSWLRQAGSASASRRSVAVTLIDQAGRPTTTWTLTGAFPTKFVSADLKASGNDVAVESLELSYEGLSVGNET